MDFFPGVLGTRTLRRTVQVRLGFPRFRGIARLHAHIHGLLTPIHEITGLAGANKGMENIFYTLHDFFTHTKGVVYLLIILTLFVLAGFWNFLTERDED